MTLVHTIRARAPRRPLPARLSRLTGMAAVIVASTAATSATEPAAALRFWASFVYGERTSARVAAVEGGDGSVSFAVVRHFDKPEAPRTAGVAVSDYTGFVN